MLSAFGSCDLQFASFYFTFNVLYFSLLEEILLFFRCENIYLISNSNYNLMVKIYQNTFIKKKDISKYYNLMVNIYPNRHVYITKTNQRY